MIDFVRTMIAYREGRIKLEHPRDENTVLVLNLDPSEYCITEITIPENTEVTALAVIDPK